MARSAVFRVELDGLEIVYIIWKKSMLDVTWKKRMEDGSLPELKNI
jgi:hypothetical protein